MIFSMTGFAVQQRKVAGGTLILELRSVNHRYLELQLRIDEGLRSYEPLLREVITSRVGRGKVDCRLMLRESDEAATEPCVCETTLERLATLSAAVRRHFPDSNPLSISDVLHWPGVLSTEQVLPETLTADVALILDAALAELVAARSREGEKLLALILERTSQIEALVEQVRPHLPVLLQTYQEKLAIRLREAMLASDDERIRQELAIFAQKIDVDEELSRLITHLQEVRRVLATGGAVGKRLDFLMQELNREANTLGSKSVATETSHVSMDLKVLIEQMREQIQNIE